MPLPTSPIERIAHRGASRERLENTMGAFTLALDRRADAIELDVHRTRDGVVVVHHDEHVNGIPLAESDWLNVAEMRLKGEKRIPRLEDVLVAVGDKAAVYIELKGDGVEGAALEVARRHGKRYAVHSFDHDAVERSMILAPYVARGVLLDRGTEDPVEALRQAHRQVRPRDVWPHFSLVDSAFMMAAATLSVRVIVWTVNDPAEAKRLGDLGVAGLCTDDVRLLANLQGLRAVE